MVDVLDFFFFDWLPYISKSRKILQHEFFLFFFSFFFLSPPIVLSCSMPKIIQFKPALIGSNTLCLTILLYIYIITEYTITYTFIRASSPSANFSSSNFSITVASVYTNDPSSLYVLALRHICFNSAINSSKDANLS